MEISIESSDPANARVAGIPLPPPHSSHSLFLRSCARSLTWAGVSVFLGRLAITRPPALTIPATIGKAQYRTYGGSGRGGAAAGRNAKRVLEARTNNRISTEFAEFVPTRGILWNKEPSPALRGSSPLLSPPPPCRHPVRADEGREEGRESVRLSLSRARAREMIRVHLPR